MGMKMCKQMILPWKIMGGFLNGVAIGLENQDDSLDNTDSYMCFS